MGIFFLRYRFSLLSFLFFLLAFENSLDQIGYVAGHFFDGCVVVLFEFLQCTTIIVGDEVDGNTLAAETTTSTDSERKWRKSLAELHLRTCFPSNSTD